MEVTVGLCTMSQAVYEDERQPPEILQTGPQVLLLAPDIQNNT